MPASPNKAKTSLRRISCVSHVHVVIATFHVRPNEIKIWKSYYHRMFCIFAVGDRWLVSPKRVLKASEGKQDDFTLHSYASAATAICSQYQAQKEIEYYKMTCRTIQDKSIEG